MNTSDDGLSHTCKGPEEVAVGLTGVRKALVKSPFIFNWRLIQQGVLSAPQIKIQRIEVNKLLGCISKTCGYIYIDSNSFLRYDVGNIPLRFSQSF